MTETKWKETNWFFANLSQLQLLALAHAGMIVTEPKDVPQPPRMDMRLLNAVSAPMFVREEGEHARR